MAMMKCPQPARPLDLRPNCHPVQLQFFVPTVVLNGHSLRIATTKAVDHAVITRWRRDHDRDIHLSQSF